MITHFFFKTRYVINQIPRRSILPSTIGLSFKSLTDLVYINWLFLCFWEKVSFLIFKECFHFLLIWSLGTFFFMNCMENKLCFSTFSHVGKIVIWSNNFCFVRFLYFLFVLVNCFMGIWFIFEVASSRIWRNFLIFD